MKEFEKYFNDEFFIIDSYNMDSIKTKLYGFIFDGKTFVENDNLSDLSDLSDLSGGMGGLSLY